MRVPLPKALQERLEPLVERAEGFLKKWEWTWTTSVVASLIISFVSLITLAVIPSWFLYFADQTLRWRSFWLLKLRDAIASGWIGTWFVIILVAAYLMQSWRRKLRGGGETRPSGGYR